jgi:hypothetical protein
MYIQLFVYATPDMWHHTHNYHWNPSTYHNESLSLVTIVDQLARNAPFGGTP